MRTLLLALLVSIIGFGCQLRDGHSAPTVSTSHQAASAGEGSVSTPSNQQAAHGGAQSNGSVSIQALPQFGKIHPQSMTELNVMLNLQAVQVPNAVRPPMDVAIVIDTSGSMSGDKMRDVKAAAIRLIRSLNKDDRVTLISYASSVRRHETHVLANDEGQATLESHIIGLHSSGSTALGPALFDAFDAFENGRSSVSRLSHVILLSDGLANVGEKRPAVLAARCGQAFRQGISVSTMGVGLNYNEDLMTKIADNGGGRYHFIKESSSIAGVLSDEFKGLVATVARNLQLEIKPVNGVRIVKVFGYPTQFNGGVSTSSIGFMGGSQNRQVLVRVSFDPKIIGTKLTKLGLVSMTYDDIIADGAKRESGLSLTVGTAPSVQAAKATENTNVTIRVAELETSAKLEIAARAVQTGDYGQARRTIRGALGMLRKQNAARPSRRLRRQIQSFEDAENEMKVAPSSAAAQKSFTKKYKARAYKQNKR